MNDDLLIKTAQDTARLSIGGPVYPSKPFVTNDADGLLAEVRHRAQNSLYFFTTAILGWNKLLLKPHKQMCDFVQDRAHNRKMLLVPRDCYKSTIASKSLPLWIVVQDEYFGLKGCEHRILLHMHSSDNAKKQIQSMKHQVERNQMLQWVFPNIIPDFTSDKWTDVALTFPREGMYGEATIECAGIDTHIVSRHYTVMIKDDLEDLASYESSTVRKKVKSSYRAAEALFVEEQTGVDVIVGTRWGSDDMYSEIQTNEGDVYDILCRPLHWTRADIERDLAEAVKGDRRPVWNMDPLKDAPDPDVTYYYFPQHFPEATCKRLRVKMGEWMYSMLYLNNPYDESLMEFKSSWLRECWLDQDNNICYEDGLGMTVHIPLESTHRVLMWDPALSEKKIKAGSDNALVVLARDRHDNFYLLDVFVDRKQPTKLVDKYIGMHQRWLCHRAGVEDAGFQRILKWPIYHRMGELDYSFPVIDQAPVGDKEFRIRGLIPIAESLKFFIRRGLNAEARAQLEGFPNYPKRDIPDAIAAARELSGQKSLAKDEHTRAREKKSEERRLAGRSTVTGY